MEKSLKQQSHARNFDGVTDEEAQRRSFLRTFTGKNVFPMALTTGDLDIEDIAHALGNQCRFSGHTKHFYSVAQHSVLVSNMLYMSTDNAELALAGLLHDASEAYLVDMPTPIKRLMPEYIKAERYIQYVIEVRFGLKYKLDCPEVHQMDGIMLATEARDLMGDPQDWNSLKGLTPFPKAIDFWMPSEAKSSFIENYKYLEDKRK